MAWACGRGLSAEAMTGEFGVEAGNTPSSPRPVPWPGGWAGMSARLASALEIIDPDVSDTSARAGTVLVTAGAGCAGSADAIRIWPALTRTVLMRTGFIGSDEPGMAAICWVWITPLVSGAGSGFGWTVGRAAVALART